MSTLAALGVKMAEEESFAMVTMADADGNGGIERDEFMAIMARFNGGEAGSGATGKWQLYWIKWLTAWKTTPGWVVKRYLQSPRSSLTSRSVPGSFLETECSFLLRRS